MEDEMDYTSFIYKNKDFAKNLYEVGASCEEEFVKNTESSINWPVYSIKFACDLNHDDKYEIVLQEAREKTMKYSILENKKNKFLYNN